MAAPDRTPRRRKSASESLTAAPICIYVAWHPEAADSDYLAREIYRWFRGDPYDLHACGTGIPVLFRAWKPGGATTAPLPLPGGGGIRVLVPLIDEHFMVTKEWRAFVYRSVGQARKDAGSTRAGAESRSDDARMTIVVPVALHPGAFQFDGDPAALNFLRLDPPHVMDGETPDQRRQRRARELRHQLTQAIGRLLLAKNSGFDVDQFARPPEPITVFLSHAKGDGTPVATALRTALRSQGQMNSFYDENDLAYGFEFPHALLRAVREQSAAMVVVLSDLYASRPWCRREVGAMRTLQMVSQGGLQRVGRLSPVVVVDVLERESSSHLPELGPAPVMRWQEGSGAAVVDRVLRQVLQYAHDLQRALRIHAALPKAAQVSTWVVNGPPDPVVLATIVNQARAAKCQKPVLIYPGPGVTADTRRAWKEWFPQLECRAFDDEVRA